MSLSRDGLRKLSTNISGKANRFIDRLTSNDEEKRIKYRQQLMKSNCEM